MQIKTFLLMHPKGRQLKGAARVFYRNRSSSCDKAKSYGDFTEEEIQSRRRGWVPKPHFIKEAIDRTERKKGEGRIKDLTPSNVHKTWSLRRGYQMTKS